MLAHKRHRSAYCVDCGPRVVILLTRTECQARYAEPKELQLNLGCRGLNLPILSNDFSLARNMLKLCSVWNVQSVFNIFMLPELSQDLNFAWSLLAGGSPHGTISDLDSQLITWKRHEKTLQGQD